MTSKARGWVGIDLDGTLAEYHGWQGIYHIGAPIHRTVEHIKYLLLSGVDVRIFTARVQEGPDAVAAIKAWCEEHLGVVLPVTNVKDFGMVYALDDRIVTVEFNTGRPLAPIPPISTVRKHWTADAVGGAAPDPEAFKHD